MRKAVVRDFFITYYNRHVVVAEDVKKTEERSQRYSQLMNYYFELFEENICGCFDYEADILDGLSKNYEKNLNYILNG